MTDISLALDLGLLAKGILLGIAAAAPIGPVNVEIARRTLLGGFRPGFALGCGAVSVDMTYAVLATLGVTPWLDRPWFRGSLTVAGVGLLVWLGLGALLQARSAFRNDLPMQLSDQGIRRGYLTGLAMTALNPMTLAFWFVVLPKVVGTLSEQPGRDLPMIVGGVFLGTIGWVIFFAGTLSLANRSRQGWLLAGANELGGLLLLLLAGATLSKSVSLPV